MSDIAVTGLSELNTLLQTLPSKIEANILREALRSGMEKVQADAQAGAAVASGAMRDGLVISTSVKGNIVTASLKATGKHAFLAKFVEFGTAAHRINAKGGALSFGGSVVQHVDHPGQRAHAFMRPALDAQAENAVIATGEYIKTRLASKEGLDTAGILVKGDH